MPRNNAFPWIVAVLAAFGSWLMQQPKTFAWAELLAPVNLGSLIVALTAVFIAGRHVTPRKGN